MTAGSIGLREELIRIGRSLERLKMIVAAEGNLSANLGGGFFLVTPAGKRKGDLSPEDLLLVNLQGEPMGDQPGRATSEWKMHQEIYSRRPDVFAVCHAHPPCATAFAASRRPLRSDLLPECVLLLGEIALASYSTPGTDEVPCSASVTMPSAPTFVVTMGMPAAMASRILILMPPPVGRGAMKSRLSR
jgi:L-fuculose-phosphate aldolase